MQVSTEQILQLKETLSGKFKRDADEDNIQEIKTNESTRIYIAVFRLPQRVIFEYSSEQSIPWFCIVYPYVYSLDTIFKMMIFKWLERVYQS